MRFLRVALLVVWLSSSLFSQTTPLHGIDVTDLDRKADPCNDFYEFANGTWRANNPIPASMTRWSKRWASGEATKDQLREISEDASKNHRRPKAAPSRSSAVTTARAWTKRESTREAFSR